MSGPFGDVDGINLAEIDEAPARVLLPAGVYTATIVELEEGTGKQSGEKYWRLKLEIEHEGHVTNLFDYRTLSWSVKNAPYAKQALIQLLASKGQALDPTARVTADTMESVLEGLQVRVKVKVEESSEYGTQNKVDRVIPINPAEASEPAAPTRPQRPHPASRNGGKADSLLNI